MDFRRIKQVCEYGWKDAETLCKEEDTSKGRWSVFCDILHCFFKYNVWSNQYKKEKLHLLSGRQKQEICQKYQEINDSRDKWVKEFFDNYKFLNKWSSFKYEQNANLQAKRRAAYKKQYGLGDNCFVGYGVIINKHHYADSSIHVGKDTHIAEECIIDYTGNITLEEHTVLSEGVKILTHEHDMDLTRRDNLNKGLIQHPLIVHDHASIGIKAIIMPGVSEIGRRSTISAGSVVRRKVPPYAIVMGNPARVVGFRYPPLMIKEFEEEHYTEEERIPLVVLEDNYKKYYLDKLQEIKQFLS